MLWVGLFQRKCWSGFQHATGHRESTTGTCKRVGYQGEGTHTLQQVPAGFQPCMSWPFAAPCAFGLTLTLAPRAQSPQVHYSYCSASFCIPGALQHHVSTEHFKQTESTSTCGLCRELFTSQGELEGHYSAEHPKVATGGSSGWSWMQIWPHTPRRRRASCQNAPSACGTASLGISGQHQCPAQEPRDSF